MKICLLKSLFPLSSSKNHSMVKLNFREFSFHLFLFQFRIIPSHYSSIFQLPLMLKGFAELLDTHYCPRSINTHINRFLLWWALIRSCQEMKGMLRQARKRFGKAPLGFIAETSSTIDPYVTKEFSISMTIPFN